MVDNKSQKKANNTLLHICFPKTYTDKSKMKWISFFVLWRTYKENAMN